MSPAPQASSSGLRILSVCQTLPTPVNPGAGIFVLNRLRAMSQLADVAVLQPVPYFPGVKSLPAWAEGDSHLAEGTRINHQPMFYLPGILKSLDGRWMERSIRSWMKRHPSSRGVNVIDAHFGYPDGVGCVRLAQRLGLPVFVTIRGLETDAIKRSFVGGQLRDALNAADGIISVSHSLRDLIANHGVRTDHVAVIPNAIDRSVFKPGDRSAARQLLGLSQTAPLIVSVGHLISGKRHHILVQALQELLRHHPEATLAIVGGAAYEPQYPQRIRKLVEDLKLTERVKFVGRVPPAQVAEWLRAADVFCLMTEREGCCNAVLEALASGAPTVTTPVGDNAHFVHDGRNGYLTPVDDPQAAARALRTALGQQWDRQKISRELAVGEWSDTANEVIQFMRGRLASQPKLRAMS